MHGRHGHLPEREILTGIGPLAVRQPRVRDRGAGAGDRERIRFSSGLLPAYTADQEPRCATADTLPARPVERRLSGGVGGPAGQGRAGAVGFDDLAPEGDVERGARSLTPSRAVGPALRLRPTVSAWPRTATTQPHAETASRRPLRCIRTNADTTPMNLQAIRRFLIFDPMNMFAPAKLHQFKFISFTASFQYEAHKRDHSPNVRTPS